MPGHPRLVTTAQAAHALHITPGILHRLRVIGVAVPAAQTEGGHARWDVEELREQLREFLDQHDNPD